MDWIRQRVVSNCHGGLRGGYSTPLLLAVSQNGFIPRPRQGISQGALLQFRTDVRKWSQDRAAAVIESSIYNLDPILPKVARDRG